MARLNNNLAYDYTIYDNNQNLPERKIKHRLNPKKKADAISWIKVIICSALVVTMLGMMIYGRVELSSLYTQQSELQAELEQYQNANLSLESELAQKTGLTKVEEYAENELGLQKLDKSQINYIQIEGETVAEVVETDDTNVFVSIKRWLSGVLEYIGA